MAQTIKLKRSSVAGNVPVSSDLSLGEIALNTADGAVYIKKGNNDIVAVADNDILHIDTTNSRIGIGTASPSSALDVVGTANVDGLTINSAYTFPTADGSVSQVLQTDGSGNLTFADAAGDQSAVYNEYVYTATNNQTSFSGSDDNSETLSYIVGFLQVFLNGILLENGTDYTATTTSSVVLVNGANTGDTLQVSTFVKVLGNGDMITDTFTGNGSTSEYTLSTDPDTEENTIVFVGGVYQEKDTYTVSGTTLTFDANVPNGISIEVVIGSKNVTLANLEDVSISGNLSLVDNKKLLIGTGNDLEIYHDGSNSIIEDAGTGHVQVRSGTFTVGNAGMSKVSAVFNSGTSQDFYYDNAKKLETTSTGVTITGAATATTFIGALQGNADTATALATGRTIALTGDVTATGVSFDGTGNISLTTTIAANSVALGTDTTGNYIQTITGTANKITVTGSGSESADVTLTLPDDVQIADSLTVAGNLTVNGTLVSLDTTNLDIEDNLFQLNAGLTGSPVNDSGMLINRGNQDNGIFMWDESVDKFTMGLTTADGTSTGNITLNSLGTLVANIEGNITGDLTGTIQTAAQPNITSVGTLTGLDVAATATMDGLTVVGETTSSNGTYGTKLTYSNGNQSGIIDTFGNHSLEFRANNDRAMNIASNGDISFYEDTGTTAKLFWDASEERLGLTGSDYQFYIQQGSNQPWYHRAVSDGSYRIHLNGTGDILTTTSTGINVTGTATMDGLTVDAAQNTTSQFTSPFIKLFPSSTTNTTGFTGITYGTSTSDNYGWSAGGLRTSTSADVGAFVFNFHNNSASGSEKMRIDSSGNVGIGTSSPNQKLSVTGIISSDANNNYYGAWMNGSSASNQYSTVAVGEWYSAGLYMQKKTGQNYSHIYNYNSSHNLILQGGSGDRGEVSGAGNVGIGTTTPTTPLSIRKAHASGYGSGIDMLDFKAYFPPNYDTETSKASIFVGTSDKHTLNTHGGYLAFKVNSSGYNGADSATSLVEYMRIEKDGNVGIGTTSPSQSLEVVDSDNYKGIHIRGSVAPCLTFAPSTSTTPTWRVGISGYDGAAFAIATGASTGDVLHIKNNGNVGIGTTTDIGYTFSVKGTMALLGPSGNSTSSIDFKNPSNTKYWGIAADQNNWYVTDADFSHYAYLSQNFTAWTFGSDRRLKENIEDISYGLEAVKAMQPRSFRFKSTGVETIGFIAQELAEVIPEAVSGEEIEYLESDSPQEKAGKSMGVSKETLIPVLVKAIQEQQTLIESLTTRLETLENA